MRIRLFVDEDAMAQALVTGLRARGIDVLTVGEEARAKLEDDEQLEFATSQGTGPLHFQHVRLLPAAYRVVDSSQIPRWDYFCAAATLALVNRFADCLS